MTVLADLLEPAVKPLAKQLEERRGAMSDGTLVSPFMISMAISLKRIADAIECVMADGEEPRP